MFKLLSWKLTCQSNIDGYYVNVQLLLLSLNKITIAQNMKVEQLSNDPLLYQSFSTVFFIR